MSTVEIASTHPTLASYEGLRQRLERNRVERERQLQQLSALGPDNAADVVAEAHRSSVERILSETEAALRRIDDDRYGRCEACGEPIPAERLDLVPHASCCVACAQRWTRIQ